MLKKYFRKCRVRIYAGYMGRSLVEVSEEDGKVLARMDVDKLEEKLGQMVRGGLFEFTTQGRKYQYITLK